MDLQPRPMENRHVRLEPMGEAHKDDLRAACDADQAIWTELYPYSMAGAHFVSRELICTRTGRSKASGGSW